MYFSGFSVIIPTLKRAMLCKNSVRFVGASTGKQAGMSLFLRRLEAQALYKNRPVITSRHLKRRVNCFWKSSSRTYATIQTGFGQPTFETRPHLLSEGEITPGISALEYHKRRNDLAEKLPVGAAAIIVGWEIKYRSGAVFYEFHQNPDFYYLTGFKEPKAVMVLEKPSEGQYIFHLFVQPKNPRKELWEGPRTGIQGALDVFNADEAGDVSRIRSYLDKIITRATSIYMDIPTPDSNFATFFLNPTKKESTQNSIVNLLKHHKKFSKTSPLTPIVQSLRAKKSAAELLCMISAGKISSHAINKAYGVRFQKEAELNAFLDYQFKIGGCENIAYIPVIAGGKNALGIHYTRNDDILNDGEMILIDAGGQYGGYCADISRAWPVNGKFTQPQADLYQAILNVQKECIKISTTSNSLDSIHHASVRLFTTELKNIGFDASISDIENVLYPHYIGHNLGLDVHDIPTVSRQGLLQNGQVITIEPGVYVPEDDRFPKYFQGIGIRIEDNVIIQEKEPIVISIDCLKEIRDVEAACEGVLNSVHSV
ncbi:peptidase M24, structural domain-containing protein [Lipomyces japonicus]|uniref:peptidase M24, structural domain-containing protein n=1 Tax=Lipomyces japonicus TaxID=56871 RepID=UPI0034CFA881